MFLNWVSAHVLEYYVQIIILLIFRKTINAETVMFAVVQLIRGAILAVIKQYFQPKPNTEINFWYEVGSNLILISNPIMVYAYPKQGKPKKNNKNT